MHRTLTRSLLALLTLILASLACDLPPETVTKGQITCRYVGYGFRGSTYYCTCPLNGVEQDIKASDLTNNSNADVYASICGPVLGSQLLQSELDQPAATEPPIDEEPTEEPASTEPPPAPAPLNPYLAGTFTTCDNAARYVNFTIAEDAPAYDPATFKFLFNGQEANCAPAPNNPKVLTCNYPPSPYGPPAIIEVFIGEERVNEFKFDGGAICDPAPIPPSNDNDDEPTPTEPPTDGGD